MAKLPNPVDFAVPFFILLIVIEMIWARRNAPEKYEPNDTLVSLAFGLTVLTIAYSLGHISGAHLNPAVTIGLWVGGRVDFKDVIPYIVSQVLGAIAAAGVLYIIATGNGSAIGNFAANGYGEHSPGH